ncbi:uncharacterized protein J3R85_009894 [Psidium guajava]|nr:uncharacterized protein J3R85_009894 [Psidium guajava]
MEDLAARPNSRSLAFSSLFAVLLLASRASPSQSCNIGASSSASASASASAAACNRSRSLTSSRLIAEDMGLEYLIDSPHISTRILTESTYVTTATKDRNLPAGCDRPTKHGTSYKCTPPGNPGHQCGDYYRAPCKPK